MENMRRSDTLFHVLAWFSIAFLLMNEYSKVIQLGSNSKLESKESIEHSEGPTGSFGF